MPSDQQEIDAHGFDKWGYLPYGSPERLAGALVGWAGIHDGHASAAGPSTTATLVVLDGAGVEVGRLPLAGGQVAELGHGLHREYAAQENANKGARRRQQMTALVVEARRTDPTLDVGNMVAWALAAAAEKLYLGVPRLVHGRPGSWEAAIVMRWAEFGGTRPPGLVGKLADRLADLLHQMGDAREDGGQVVADLLGHAAQELGGLQALAEGSFWAPDVWNLAKALNYDDQWEPF